MMDTETAAEWVRQEPQRTLIAMLDTLQDNGHAAGELGETMLTLALTMGAKLHGRRDMAQRLYLLAQCLNSEADVLEGISRSGTVN